jgi:deaminated glutathione amidase
MNQIKVGLAQLTSIDNRDANIKQIFDLLKTIENEKCNIVFFPENCLYLRIQEGSEIPPFLLTDEVFNQFQNWVDQFSCAIHLGSVPILKDKQLLNASVWLEPKQAARISYTKIHLFDIELAGQKPIKESDVFSHGAVPQVLNYLGWKFGQSICYDIRFSYLYDFYAKKEVDAILIPSAFLTKTGESHWEVLNRARAIESQAYVIASAQGGEHKSSKGNRFTYGHSLIVDPWGKKLLEIESSPSIELLSLSREEIISVRRQIPMSKHRRTVLSVTES